LRRHLTKNARSAHWRCAVGFGCANEKFPSSLSLVITSLFVQFAPVAVPGTIERLSYFDDARQHG
jgi:hypothetical protein